MINGDALIIDMDGKPVPAPIFNFWINARHAMTLNDSVD